MENTTLENKINTLLEDMNAINDVYKAIQYAHSLKIELPTKLIKPILKDKHTSTEVLEYSKKLELYEISMITYKEKVEQTRELEYKIFDIVIEYIKLQSGLYDYVPVDKQNKVYSLAYERGHSEGYYGVYQQLDELVDLFM
jgi:hypothetical protein